MQKYTTKDNVREMNCHNIPLYTFLISKPVINNPTADIKAGVRFLTILNTLILNFKHKTAQEMIVYDI